MNLNSILLIMVIVLLILVLFKPVKYGLLPEISSDSDLVVKEGFGTKTTNAELPSITEKIEDAISHIERDMDLHSKDSIKKYKKLVNALLNFNEVYALDMTKLSSFQLVQNIYAAKKKGGYIVPPKSLMILAFFDFGKRGLLQIRDVLTKYERSMTSKYDNKNTTSQSKEKGIFGGLL